MGVALDLTTALLRALLATTESRRQQQQEEQAEATAYDDMTQTARTARAPLVWRSMAAELLDDGRLVQLLAEPHVMAATTQALRGWRCTHSVEMQEPTSNTKSDPSTAYTSAHHISTAGAPPTNWAWSSSDPRPVPDTSRESSPTTSGSRRMAMSGSSHGEGAALLAALVPDPRAKAAWAALRGWSAESVREKHAVNIGFRVAFAHGHMRSHPHLDLTGKPKRNALLCPPAPLTLCVACAHWAALPCSDI